jgi:hypothetical protein
MTERVRLSATAEASLVTDIGDATALPLGEHPSGNGATKRLIEVLPLDRPRHRISCTFAGSSGRRPVYWRGKMSSGI